MNFLYEDLTHKVIGAAIAVHKELGSGHKESIYHKALIEEFNKQKIAFSTEQKISVSYNATKVGTYQPDFVVDEKIIIELKAVPFVSKNHVDQLAHYLRGSNYKLGLLINFGEFHVKVKRIIWDRE